MSNKYSNIKSMIKEIGIKEQWDEYINKCIRKTFLQSYQWGQFQKSLNKDVKYLSVFDNGNLRGVALCIKERSLFGNYIYIPRGPLLINENEEIYKKVINEIKEYFKDVISIKIDPAYTESNPLAKVPSQLGFIHSINFIQSETNWIIDLKGNTEEELLTWCREHGMVDNYPKYIRKAKRDGVEISFSKDRNDWELFHKYLTESGKRKSFEVRSKEYFLNMYDTLSEDNIVRLGMAKRDGHILAMILIAVDSNEISCLYSAQTDIDTKLRAPLLLRWECMLMGQREGIKRFNNWGVLPESKYKPNNPGYGYSQYKRSFGGYLEQLERTYEYPYDKLKNTLQRIYDWYIKIRYYKYR